MKAKKGIVPRPASSGYQAGTTEKLTLSDLQGKKGHTKNDVVEIAPSPEVHNREYAQPSMGTTQKIIRGKPRQYRVVKQAIAKPVSKDVINQQLGSNRHLGS